MDFFHAVNELLNMCCSSVLPGGGTNMEYGLHSLFEAKGDIMVSLLSSTSSHFKKAQ